MDSAAASAELSQVRGGTEVHYRRTGGIRADAYDSAGTHALLRAVGHSGPAVRRRAGCAAGQPEGDGAQHTVLVTTVRAAEAPGGTG